MIEFSSNHSKNIEITISTIEIYSELIRNAKEIVKSRHPHLKVTSTVISYEKEFETKSRFFSCLDATL